jgi:hypothetical protein
MMGTFVVVMLGVYWGKTSAGKRRGAGDKSEEQEQELRVVSAWSLVMCDEMPHVGKWRR